MSCSREDQLRRHDQDSSGLSHPSVGHPSASECSAAVKCCTQACFLREEQNTRELQKLHESYVALKLETDKEISFLKQQLASALASGSSLSKTHSATSLDSYGSRSPPYRSASVVSSPSTHELVPTVYSITDKGVKPSGRIDRLGSIQSAQVLATLRPPLVLATGGTGVARRVLAALADPMVATQPYLRSLQFAADLVNLSAQVSVLLERESRCLKLPSPVYVFGDIHGNWEDLRFFSEHMWHLGLELTAGSFLFLGDYVDRGSSSLECTAYLFAQKLLNPSKLFLLRGNHETRAVNGLEAHYGSGCLLAQCKARFGVGEGGVVWHQLNHAFDRLPLAAVIDEDIFCVHGGIPRPIEGSENLLESIAKLPPAASLDTLDTNYFAGNPQLIMIADMIWGDPVRNEAALDRTEAGIHWRLDSQGFGKSPRGGVAVRFGSRAVDAFLSQFGFSRILRAHEAAHDGLSFSNSARVITVFSTSKDHGLGDDASCGCILVDNQYLRFFNRARNASRRQQQQQIFRLHNPSHIVSSVARSSVNVSASTYNRHVLSGGLRSQVVARESYDDDTDDEDEQGRMSSILRSVSDLSIDDNNQADDH